MLEAGLRRHLEYRLAEFIELEPGKSSGLCSIANSPRNLGHTRRFLLLEYQAGSTSQLILYCSTNTSIRFLVGAAESGGEIGQGHPSAA